MRVRGRGFTQISERGEEVICGCGTISRGGVSAVHCRGGAGVRRRHRRRILACRIPELQLGETKSIDERDGVARLQTQAVVHAMADIRLLGCHVLSGAVDEVGSIEVDALCHVPCRDAECLVERPGWGPAGGRSGGRGRRTCWARARARARGRRWDGARARRRGVPDHGRRGSGVLRHHVAVAIDHDRCRCRCGGRTVAGLGARYGVGGDEGPHERKPSISVVSDVRDGRWRRRVAE